MVRDLLRKPRQDWLLWSGILATGPYNVDGAIVVRRRQFPAFSQKTEGPGPSEQNKEGLAIVVRNVLHHTHGACSYKNNMST